MRNIVHLVVFVSFIASGYSRTEDDIQKIVSKLQKRCDSITDFRASFEQRYFSVTLNKTKISSGRLYLKKPGKVRWDYQKPQPKHFLLNGSELTIYDPELEQVMVNKYFSSSEMTTALEFLLGQGKLADSFTISFAEKTPFLGEGWQLKLTPRKKASFSALYLLAGKTDFQVLETYLEDSAGNRNHLIFSRIKINRKLRDDIFKLVIPAGVEVVPIPKDAEIMP